MPDKSYAQIVVSLRTGRDVETLLRELYIEKRWTDREIASHLGLTRQTIQQWRTEFGIARSGRNGALS